MLVSTYETLSQLVKVLGFAGADDVQLHVTLLTVKHENDDIPSIEVDYSTLTPYAWYKVYQNVDVIVIEEVDLDKIYMVLCRQIIRLKMKDEEEKDTDEIFIVDGLLTSISIIFSQFVHDQRIEFDKLNFRKVYLILQKLIELDELIGYKVQINDTNEIWNLVNQIFLPCRRETENYQKLVDFLSNAEGITEHNDKSILGVDEFVCLETVLTRFGIEK